MLAKVCINHQSLVADCILIHALTLAILDSQGCLQIFIPSSSAPVKMAAQHHSFFSTSQQNLWASRGRVDVERQGSWHRELNISAASWKEPQARFCLPCSYCGKGIRGLDPQQEPAPEPWCQPEKFTVPGASWSHRVTLPGLQTIAYRTNIQW